MNDRQFGRLNLEGLVLVKNPTGRWTMANARLDNLSRGGLRMHAPVPFCVDQEVSFDVRTPYSLKPVTGYGRIRHVRLAQYRGTRGFAMGVEFSQVNRRQLGCILAEKIYGGERRIVEKRNRVHEFRIFLTLVPVLVAVTWFVLSGFFMMQGSVSRGADYLGSLGQALIHFFYHST